MKLRVILGVSMCLNALLLTLLAMGLFSPPPAHSSDTTAPSEFSAVADANRHSPKTPELVSSLPRPIPWQKLQSDDLRAYISNLRAAGFPEPLVHKIIIAELDRHLAAERRNAPVNTNYWKTGFERDAAERKRREEQRAAASIREGRIRELLGKPLHQASGYGDELWGLIHLTGVSDLETLDRLSGVSLRLRSAGNTTGQDQSDPGARRKIHDQAMAEMRAILGPARTEEFELRSIAADVMDVWGAEMLFGCIMSGAEFREFLRLRKEITPPSDRARGNTLQIPDAPPELTQKVDEQIRALLGEERFNGYRRARNGGFKEIHSVFRKEETMELSWAVYDIYAALKETSAQVHHQPGFGPAEREAALLSLRANTERALEAKMGPENFANYYLKNRRNFHWIDELTVKEPIHP